MINNSTSFDLNNFLNTIGFTPEEKKILLLLIKNKNLNINDISKKASIASDLTKYILRVLKNKKLVTSKNDKDFIICPKKDFINYVNKKRRNILKDENIEGKDVQKFLSNMAESSWKPTVMYFEGAKGIKEIYEDILDTAKDNIYSWLDIPKIYEVLGDYLYDYINLRISKGIKSHDIVPKNEMNLRHFKKKENREIKFVDKLSLNGEVRIYSNKVAIITFDGEKPIGIVIQGTMLSRLFKAIFDSFWNFIK